MDEIMLSVELRDKVGGKGWLKNARKQDKIPGIIYGGEKPPMPITIAAKDLNKILKGGLNVLLKLQYPDGSDTAILKTLQNHAVTGAPLHIDFQRVSLKQMITLKVPVRLTGESKGVKDFGGILEHVMREVTVKCLPTAIPKEITIDISGLGISDGISVKDIRPPEGVELTDDPSRIIVHVVIAKEEEVAPEAEAAAAVAAEPEVIAKGKKEEEGAEAAPAEKGAEKAAPEKKEAAKTAEKK